MYLISIYLPIKIILNELKKKKNELLKQEYE